MSLNINMVAVKSIWDFWKSLSTSISFLGSGKSRRDSIKNDTKHLKYNRLRTLRKSISSHFPASGSAAAARAPSRSSSTTSFNCLKKSNSYDVNRNSSNTIGSTDRTLDDDDDDDDDYYGRQHQPRPTNAANIRWNYTLDNSDSEYEDDDNNFVKELDAYHMRMTIEEISDLDDEDEALTCDVCDRSFPTAKRLADHQFKKRHYGCLQCDSIFPTRQALDEHREQMDHYDYATNNYGSDTTSFGSAAVDDNDHNNGITIIQEEEENLLL